CGKCGRACPSDPALDPFHITYTCDGPNPDGGLPDCTRVCVTQPGWLWLHRHGNMQLPPASGARCDTFRWGRRPRRGVGGKACKPGEVCHPINATSIQQECGCPKPLTYCPGPPYCRNLQNDPYNCGMCDHVCPTPPHAKPTCQNGKCGYECDFGFEDCNHNYVDGCEIDTLNNPENCGGCNNDCDGGADVRIAPANKGNNEHHPRCPNLARATTRC